MVDNDSQIVGTDMVFRYSRQKPFSNIHHDTQFWEVLGYQYPSMEMHLGVGHQCARECNHLHWLKQLKRVYNMGKMVWWWDGRTWFPPGCWFAPQKTLIPSSLKQRESKSTKRESIQCIEREDTLLSIHFLSYVFCIGSPQILLKTIYYHNKSLCWYRVFSMYFLLKYLCCSL